MERSPFFRPTDMNSDKPKRLNVEISPELLTRLYLILRWGLRRKLITALIERFVDDYQRRGQVAIHDALNWRNNRET